MECAIAREAVSAQLDGEQPPVDPAEVATHLAGCASCRAWLDAANEMTRRVGLAASKPVPDRTEALLTAVLADQAGRRARQIGRARIGLIVMAAAQVLFGLSSMLFGPHMQALHLTHELDTFDLALIVGFLTAARRPAHAAGMVALVGVVAVGLLGTAVLDVVEEHTSILNEASHLPAIAGWLLLWRLARLGRLTPSAPTIWQALLPRGRRRSGPIATQR